MGWLSLRSRLQGSTSFEPVFTQVTDSKSVTEHVEHVQHVEHVETIDNIYAPSTSEYPLQDPSVPDEALPFIPPAIVRSQRLRFSKAKVLAWIVVDNIVYDCTEFIKEHPGGETVIQSFIGEDCSWQLFLATIPLGLLTSFTFLIYRLSQTPLDVPRIRIDLVNVS